MKTDRVALVLALLFLSSTMVDGAPAEVEATGQTTCEDVAGDPVACAGTGHDGDIKAGAAWPIPRFTDNNNGTVTDNLTGLIWLRDASCEEYPGTDGLGLGDWQTALTAAHTLASGLCGLSDGSTAGSWRLPNLAEAQSLLTPRFGSPYIPDTVGHGLMTEGDPFVGEDEIDLKCWVSTSWVATPSIGSFVQYRYGTVGLDSKTEAHSIWPVRGSTAGSPAAVERTGQVTCYSQVGVVVPCAGTGQDGDHRAGVVWPNPRFVDNGDGTVSDRLTDLIWLKDATCSDLGGEAGWMSWGDALAATAGLAHGACGLADSSEPGDWRLPNAKEMLSLIDLEYQDPALSNAAGSGQWSEGNAFVGVIGWEFWSSSSQLGWSPASALVVSVGSGSLTTDNKSNMKYVWPVQGGRLPLLFANGFESGASDGWSATVP